MPWVINQWVAPFLAGGLSAAASTVEELEAALILIGFAVIFSMISLDIPRRMIAWMKRSDR